MNKLELMKYLMDLDENDAEMHKVVKAIKGLRDSDDSITALQTDLEKLEGTLNLDKGLSLYRNGISPFFWCRVKLPGLNSGDFRTSTKASSIQEATMKAGEIRADVLARFEAGTLKVNTRILWTYICKEVEDILTKKAADKIAKSSDKSYRPTEADYAGIVKNHYATFEDFKRLSITAIEYPELCQMMQHEKFQNMKKTTATKRKTTLGLIFDYALQKRYIKSVPKLPKFDFIESEGGDVFDIDDRDLILMNFMNFYESSRNNKITRHKRKLLPLYFNFLCASGMRPGKEVMGLTWGLLTQETFVMNRERKKAYKMRVVTGKMAKHVSIGNKIERKSRNFVINAETASTLEQLYYVRYGIKKSIGEIAEEKRNDVMFAGFEGRNPKLEESFDQYMTYLKKVGLKGDYTLYSCRYEYINACLDAGMSKDDVASQVGNTPATINTFYEKFNAMKRAARILSAEDIAVFNPEPEEDK
ncbi:hypothetical protein CJF42_03310 [Pseudoalteromonas sp. NBT06-2]|uniref:hypothetical protein n=1 Tax=Pseudoalteromonas sp. NBT06-2 TaxID=2025950 RepID=UPI000BA67FD1|nr:hypothetical protein [Pseudoalteromonas sp. NBT06-2]PAJ75759.1 hypothetical protein CJF42_03310 [Pseudoalteromonas sp. NBT06-2]